MQVGATFIVFVNTDTAEDGSELANKLVGVIFKELFV